MGVSKNNGIPKSPILIGFSIINHPFWGTPIFGNIHIYIYINIYIYKYIYIYILYFFLFLACFFLIFFFELEDITQISGVKRMALSQNIGLEVLLVSYSKGSSTIIFVGELLIHIDSSYILRKNPLLFQCNDIRKMPIGSKQDCVAYYTGMISRANTR